MGVSEGEIRRLSICEIETPQISATDRVSPKKPCNITDLQQAQAFKSILDQLLYLAFLCGVLVLAERISCLPTSVFTEVVVGKLSGMAQEGAELRKRKTPISLMYQG